MLCKRTVLVHQAQQLSLSSFLSVHADGWLFHPFLSPAFTFAAVRKQGNLWGGFYHVPATLSNSLQISLCAEKARPSRAGTQMKWILLFRIQ